MIGCGTATEPTRPEPVVVVPEPRPEPVPDPGALPSPGIPCLPADDFGFVLEGSIRGSRLVYCQGGSCLEHDLATNRAIPVAHRPLEGADAEPARSGPHWRVEPEARKLFVCTTADSTGDAATCVPAAMGGLTFEDFVAPSANDDGTRVVVMLIDPKVTQGSQLTVAVFDTRSGKRLLAKRVGDESLMCGTARFVGPSVLVALDVCAGPGGEAWLANPTKLARIARLGPEDFGGYDPRALHLRGTEWAFLEQGAASVLVQDVTTGRVITRHDLRPHYADREAPPMGGSFHRLDSGEILVALAESRSGTFVVLDLATGQEVKVQSVRTCGAP